MIIFTGYTFALRTSFIAQPVFSVHGLRFLLGLRFTAVELVGERSGSVGVVAVGPATGNANVGDVEDVADAVGIGDGSALGKGEELGTGLGVGDGGMIFSHLCSPTLAPPISLTSASQRA